ncbi:MAG: right-handed parallel beta-helix repeat-containing protein [Bacteroidetes bacterium]|nr:MAG: right-handed parallel beta-helix repeat-containing protein [Bacteroidota bacterium]
MKKILIVLSLICSVVSSLAQSGDGSSGNPFWGTISSTVQWSIGDPNYGSTVYVGTVSNPDLTVGSGGHLTIDPGITVIFTQLTTDLFVTGTGQLTAGGTGSQVTFTKAPANGHWGHISFQNMTGTPASSTFNNCLFEYGYSVGTSSEPLLTGGALQVDFNDVVITTCTFRNNYATFAGAVMINTGRNAIIRNSYFKSNSVYECGGALILYTSSTGEIENCIFESNYSQGFTTPVYSGGAIWSYSNTSKIINCTFVENTSGHAGAALYSYSSSGMSIINSIFWGSNDQVAGSLSTSTITTSAFESAKPSEAANSIIISAVANDHFVNAGASDWTLIFSSPCRDAGTTPSPTVDKDYAGNFRIGPYDIGAYEVQYSRWLTNAAAPTSWLTGTNWELGFEPGHAGTTGDAVIPYLANDTYAPNISGSITIASTKYLILKPGAKATFGTLTNSGTLKLESDATNISSLIVTTFSGNAANVELYLSGGGGPAYKWHYISTPVSSLAVSTFTGVTSDIAQFIESAPTFSIMEGWRASDGYSYSSGTITGPTFSTLDPGKGYNYYDAVNQAFTFSGTLNTGNVAITLGYSGTPSLHGFNLLGNPFSSGLDWDVITGGTYPSSTSKGLYFTRDNAQCTYIAGVGTPGDVTAIIPPMQGFFVKANGTPDIQLTLPASARTHNSIHSRYKGNNIIPLVRLSVTENSIPDETVVRFDALAKTYFDNDFDALKMFESATTTSIYSSLSGTKYAINGQPFPDTFVEIPIVVNLTTSGNHTISTTQLQGLDSYPVTLTDKTTGFIADLKTTPNLSFDAPAGTITDRFVLKVGTVLTGTENPVASKNIFNIYTSNNFINIQTIADGWDGKTGSVKMIDLAGKTITNLQNAGFSKNSVLQVPCTGVKGMYVVEIRSGVMRYVGKVVIR